MNFRVAATILFVILTVDSAISQNSFKMVQNILEQSTTEVEKITSLSSSTSVDAANSAKNNFDAFILQSVDTIESLQLPISGSATGYLGQIRAVADQCCQALIAYIGNQDAQTATELDYAKSDIDETIATLPTTLQEIELLASAGN